MLQIFAASLGISSAIPNVVTALENGPNAGINLLMAAMLCVLAVANLAVLIAKQRRMGV
jgi:hypothetical protein